MLTHSTTAVLVAAATVSLAMTPPNFAPASTTDLFVNFNGIAALNGAVVAKASQSSKQARRNTLAGTVTD